MAKDGYWACARLDDNGYITDQYMGAVEEYITFAMNEQWFTSGDRIRCPCLKCQKRSFLKHDDVRRYLYYTGFCNDPLSGVGQSSRVRAEFEHEYNVEVENQYANMVRDAFYTNADHSWNCDGGSMSMDPEPSLRPSSFFSLLNDADEPVWPGCTKHTTLSALSQLLNCKSEFNISENCFNRLMVIIKGILPENNNLPENYYQMKKKMAAFGLRYVKIDVCDNNCMLFNGEFEELEYCSVCGHPRYKSSNTSERRVSKIPYKILRYFPLIPRLQRLFMLKKTSQNMTWHAHNQSSPTELHHPADGEAWQHFNRTHESFSSEARNIRLGLCTDGFAPFKQGARPYSCWPVMLVIYNLPPWLCMKQPYLFLNMIIPGPNSPSQNIDVFLRPSIDELLILWQFGVRTYDNYTHSFLWVWNHAMWQEDRIINAGDASYSACSRPAHEHEQTPVEVDNLQEEVTLVKDRIMNLEDKVEKQASDTADIKKYLEQLMEMFNPARMFTNASMGPSQPTS